jgi:hypothetical protein
MRFVRSRLLLDESMVWLLLFPVPSAGGLSSLGLNGNFSFQSAAEYSANLLLGESYLESKPLS